MAITSAQVQQLYVAYLGRAADKAGLDYWLNELNGSTTAPATLTLEDLRSNFVNEQTEYQDAYAGLTRSETVSKIYLQLFGHSADAAGLTYWTTGGGATVATDQLLVAFVNGAGATDAKIVANKVLVAEVYTSTAGSNYVADDAKSVLANVTDSTASVTTALTNLGNLPGIALPANVALLKAADAATAAVTAYETSKVASLVSLNDKVVALNADYSANLASVADGNDTNTTVDYAEAVNAIANATALRTAISASTTTQLSTASTTAAEKVAADRADLIAKDPNAVTKINAYNAAVAADAKVVDVDATAKANGVAAFDGLLTVTANKTAFDAAVTSYKTASGSTATITDAAGLYTELLASAGNTAKLAQLDTAFNTGAYASNYTSLKTLSTTEATKDASEAAVTTAADAVSSVVTTSTYVADSVAATAAAKILADAQAADALVAQGTAETTAHTAVVQSSVDANAAVTANTAIKDFDGGVAVNGDAQGTVAELFHFSAIKAADDFTLANFTKGDAIYVGEGHTFNSNVTIGTDGFAVGTNVAVKEVYFTQATAGGDVSVNIETNAVGQTAGTGTTDNVAVITLTGVTSLSDVSFANGVITTTHVA
ncbi:protein of unknown function [Pseudomonas asturiensis]|uniref:DUF4214 domain-containing protein n=1 Tax=Pseudomonas asturiensis TaxID=1190415 RepID=A0A1M7PCZ1_9PSED|nr:DUF4214 domain-containing protein [Pseudomonas asturiensis]SHN14337.1 protein of unknown function [Pseudomonas asturiensis]